MKKVYLKFEHYSACISPIAEANLDVNDTKVFQHHPGLAKETGETATDSNGNEYPVMVPVPGHHIDMYIEDDDEVPESLKDFVVPTPDNPVHRLR
jgi:hypothetical protein